MSIVAASFGASAIVLLVAAPGEPPIAAPDVSDVAKAAVIRRLEPTDFPSFRGIVVMPSERMPGYVVCGEVSGRQPEDPERFERFFVVVPGSFALLDRDGSALIDNTGASTAVHDRRGLPAAAVRNSPRLSIETQLLGWSAD